MAYDETTYRRSAEAGGTDPAYRASGTTGDQIGEQDLTDTGGRTADSFGSIPRYGYDEGRDRLGIHVGWEVVLLVAAAVICFLLYRQDPAALQRPALDTLLLTGTAIGLLTLAAGVSMRAGVPNLAVGSIAVAGAVQFAENGDKGLLPAALPAIAIAAIGALAVAVFVLALHVPGWAASLGAALGVITWIQLRHAPIRVQGEYDPKHQAFFLFGGFALLAVLGGAFATVSPIRRLVGRMRPVGDPAHRRGGAAVLPVVVALILSSVFAVAAGILMAATSSAPVVPDTGLQWTGIAFGTALLAGTSAFGRRGGVFGTLLAVIGMTAFLDYADRRELHIALFAVAAVAVGAGLIVTRLVETYGRSLSGGTFDDWNGAATTGTSWRPDLMDNWTTNPPNQQRGDRWDDGQWGSAR
jgi:hypothetical protein